jgi:hypothetical protein
MKSSPEYVMNSIPDELLPAFCLVPASAVALSVVCRRFHEYFRAAPPVFTIAHVVAHTHTISSDWYVHALDLKRLHYDGGAIDDLLDNANPFQYIYGNSPLYVLGDTNFDGSVYFSTTMPWFYPLTPLDMSYSVPGRPIQMRWFRRAQVFEQKQNECCHEVRNIGSPINAFITHGGGGQYLMSVNESVFVSQTHTHTHAAALYRIVRPTAQNPAV